MGTPLKPLPVKLFVGLIAADKHLFQNIQHLLAKKFGPIDAISPIWNFDQTKYYEKEMGQDLKRQFFSFQRLISAEKLTLIKRYANALEKKFSRQDSRRQINMDPGYVSSSKMVLATTKNFSHRIYVAKGIFEEITYYYKDGTFQPGPWTYPDFRCETHIHLFNAIRKKYYEQIEKTYGLSKLSRCL